MLVIKKLYTRNFLQVLSATTYFGFFGGDEIIENKRTVIRYKI